MESRSSKMPFSAAVGMRWSGSGAKETEMISAAIAVSLMASQRCPATDAQANLLSLHEATRQGHLQGDAGKIAGTIGDRLLLAENGTIRIQSKAQVTEFFTGYLRRVRYSEWRDVSPPAVTISPDGRMAWMAVELEAKYTSADKPAEPEKTFKSSWIATYERDQCIWRMTGIASDVAE